MNPDLKQVGMRIKEIRLSKGETGKEFGSRFCPKASDSIVSRWERGISLPSPKRLRDISNIGKITAYELLYGNDLKKYTDLELLEELNARQDMAEQVLEVNQ